VHELLESKDPYIPKVSIKCARKSQLIFAEITHGGKTTRRIQRHQIVQISTRRNLVDEGHWNRHVEERNFVLSRHTLETGTHWRHVVLGPAELFHKGVRSAWERATVCVTTYTSRRYSRWWNGSRQDNGGWDNNFWVGGHEVRCALTAFSYWAHFGQSIRWWSWRSWAERAVQFACDTRYEERQYWCASDELTCDSAVPEPSCQAMATRDWKGHGLESSSLFDDQSAQVLHIRWLCQLRCDRIHLSVDAKSKLLLHGYCKE